MSCDKVVCERVVLWESCACDKVAGADRGGRRADGAGGRRTEVHNKKQEPHTKMWGIIIITTVFDLVTCSMTIAYHVLCIVSFYLM